MSNIANYREIIMEELRKEYPMLIRHIYLPNGEIIINKELNYYKNYYKEKYGEHMTIKSIKKIPVKVLTPNNKDKI